MNYIFDGTVANNLKDENTTVTVFKKVEESWEKLLDPFYTGNSMTFPKIDTWRKEVTISIALNQPIEGKSCKITKTENGTTKGPTKVGDYKWEIEIISGRENHGDPVGTSVEIDVSDGE
ncbi:MAG: hypothetical protein GY940_08640 [bacterium]|nr:hypothetical protein [bacterium]